MYAVIHGTSYCSCAIDGIFVYNGVRLRVLTPKLGKERKVPMYKMLKS